MKSISFILLCLLYTFPTTLLARQDASTKLRFLVELCNDDAVNRDYLLEHANIVGSQKQELLKVIPEFKRQYVEMGQEFQKESQALQTAKLEPKQAQTQISSLQKEFFTEVTKLTETTFQQIDDLLIGEQLGLLNATLLQRRSLRIPPVPCFFWLLHSNDELGWSLADTDAPREHEQIILDFQSQATKLRNEVFKQVTDGWSDSLKNQVHTLLSLQEDIFKILRLRSRDAAKPERTAYDIISWTKLDFDRFETAEQLSFIANLTYNEQLGELLKISDFQLAMLKEAQSTRTDKTKFTPEEQNESQEAFLAKIYNEILNSQQSQLFRLAGKYSRDRLEQRTGDEFALLLVAIDGTTLEPRQKKDLSSKILQLRQKYNEKLHQLRLTTADKILQVMPEEARKKFEEKFFGKLYDYQDEVAHAWTEARAKAFGEGN